MNEEYQQEWESNTPTPDIRPHGAPKRLPIKTRTLRLPDEYGAAGMTVKVRTNVASGLMDDALGAHAPTPPDFKDLEQRAAELERREKAGEDIDSGWYDEIDEEQRERLVDFRTKQDESEKRRLDALTRIVLEHNNWVDEDDNPYPQANTHAFWQAIPTELASAILVLVRREASRLPNAMMRTGSKR